MKHPDKSDQGPLITDVPALVLLILGSVGVAALLILASLVDKL